MLPGIVRYSVGLDITKHVATSSAAAPLKQTIAWSTYPEDRPSLQISTVGVVDWPYRLTEHCLLRGQTKEGKVCEEYLQHASGRSGLIDSAVPSCQPYSKHDKDTGTAKLCGWRRSWEPRKWWPNSTIASVDGIGDEQMLWLRTLEAARYVHILA